VLEDMATIHARAHREDARGLGKTAEAVMEAALRQRETLRKEVDKYCAERGVQRG